MTDTPPDLEAIAARADELVKKLRAPTWYSFTSDSDRKGHPVAPKPLAMSVEAADLIVTLLDRIRDLDIRLERANRAASRYADGLDAAETRVKELEVSAARRQAEYDAEIEVRDAAACSPETIKALIRVAEAAQAMAAVDPFGLTTDEFLACMYCREPEDSSLLSSPDDWTLYHAQDCEWMAARTALSHLTDR